MAKKPHGLLILFEGLPATVIHSQVFDRIQFLDEYDIASFDVISYASNRRLFTESLKQLNTLQKKLNGRLTLARCIRPAMPGSHFANRLKLQNFVENAARYYDFVQARTDYSAAVAGPICKQMGIPMIWDCRGDAEGEFIERNKKSVFSSILSHWRAHKLRKDAQQAANFCSAATFVSHPLSEMWRNELHKKPYEIIPCLADERTFYFSPELRQQSRKQLGYTDNDIVFVFSGSIAHYQGLDLVSDWFYQLHKKSLHAHLIVLTPSVEKAKSIFQKLPTSSVRVLHADYESVNSYLNAADYGVLIRPASRTNTSAFPTKFAEFSLAGLRVVISPSVPDCHRYAVEAGNDAPVVTNPEAFSSNLRDRERISRYARRTLTHKGHEGKTRGLYETIDENIDR